MPFDRGTFKLVLEHFANPNIIGLLEHLNDGNEGQEWQEELDRFVAGKPCWQGHPSPVTGMPMCKRISKTPIYFSPLLEFAMPESMEDWKHESSQRAYVVDDKFAEIFSGLVVPETDVAYLWQFRMHFDYYTAEEVFKEIRRERSVSAAQLLLLVEEDRLQLFQPYLVFVRADNQIVPVFIQSTFDGQDKAKWSFTAEGMDDNFGAGIVLITNGFDF